MAFIPYPVGSVTDPFEDCEDCSTFDENNPYNIEDVSSEGSVYVTGDPWNGVIGGGSVGGLIYVLESRSIGDNDIVSVVGGVENSFALTAEGDLYGTGYNHYGALGLGDSNMRTSFTKLSPTDVSKVDSKGNFSIILKTDGTIWTAGLNTNGQLGIDSVVNSDEFVQESLSSTAWTDISAGWTESYALRSDGSVWATGYNYDGAFGIGDTIQKQKFTQIGIGYSAIYGGYYNSYFLKSDGTLWVAGNNSNGRLGLGDTTRRLTRVQVGSATDWSKICPFYESTVALKTGGTIYGAGQTSNGQLGELKDLGAAVKVFTQIESDSDWADLSHGRYHTIARKKDYSIYALGYGNYGQLSQGAGITSNLYEFTKITSIAGANWGSIACTQYSTLAVSRDQILDPFTTCNDTCDDPEYNDAVTLVSGTEVLDPGDSADYTWSDGTVTNYTMPLGTEGTYTFGEGGIYEMDVRSSTGQWVEVDYKSQAIYGSGVCAYLVSRTSCSYDTRSDRPTLTASSAGNAYAGTDYRICGIAANKEAYDIACTAYATYETASGYGTIADCLGTRPDLFYDLLGEQHVYEWQET